jgi:hypothetical protein
LGGIHLGSIVGEDDTAPTLLAKLGSGKREAFLFTSSKTLLGGEGGSIEVDGIRKCAALGRVIGVTAKRLVVINSGVVGPLGKCRVLPNRKAVIAAARLGLVAIAGERALGLVELRAVDGGTTEADAVVFQSGITEAIACPQIVSHMPHKYVFIGIILVLYPVYKEGIGPSCTLPTEIHTFTLGNTLLYRHVLLIQAGSKDQSIRAAILETARVNEWLERLNAWRQLNVPRLGQRDESNGSHGKGGPV